MAKKKDDTEDLIIDVDSYDWGEEKFTKKEKLFCIYFTLPRQEGFENPTKAAMKAGYNTKTAYTAKQNILSKEKIKNAVERFRKDLVITTIDSAYNLFIQEKIKRATFNIQDYYENSVYEDEDTGAKTVRTQLKPLDELTREQAAIIDNVQINQSGIATYELPKKDKQIDDILKLHKEIHGNDVQQSDFEIDTTIDIVKQNLEGLKISINSRKNSKNKIDFIENSENQPDFD